MPTKRAKLLGPVNPNAGVEAEYRRRLTVLVEKMHRSVVRQVEAAYRANPSRLAMDRDAPLTLADVIRKLRARWTTQFNALGPDLGRYFAQSATKRSDASLRAALKRAGFTVEFKMSAPVREAVTAMTKENVSLIRSIPAEYMQAVEGAVMRSVSTGRDLGTLAKELEHQFGVTKRRAAFIARDQNNKATAVVCRARQMELGLTQARWLHSAGGKHPRPEHVKASKDRLVYDVTKGAFLEGRWTWPGHEMNCRCVSVAIIPGIKD